MKSIKNLIVVATLTVMSAIPASSAMASVGNLSYEDFLDSCSNPGSYGAQRPAQNIRLACTNVQTAWLPIESGGTELGETRHLSTELFSDKYHVVLENFVIETPEYQVICPKFREVLETSQIEKMLTCEQVLAETRDLKEICLDSINEAIAANPDIVEVVATGRIFSTCDGSVQK